jgi:hypothetical protein
LIAHGVALPDDASDGTLGADARVTVGDDAAANDAASSSAPDARPKANALYCFEK